MTPAVEATAAANSQGYSLLQELQLHQKALSVFALIQVDCNPAGIILCCCCQTSEREGLHILKTLSAHVSLFSIC